MSWVDFKGVTFNLDKVTHFETIETVSAEKSELRAYLNIGFANTSGIVKHQAYITIAKGTKDACKKWMTEIVAGEYNLPEKQIYSIMQSLKEMNISLEKIAKDVEVFAERQ